jgi:hypothetical protein
MAQHIITWLSDREERSRLVARLEQLRDQVGHGGAARTAAQLIVAALDQQPAKIPRPHFLPPAPDTTSSPGRLTAESPAE